MNRRSSAASQLALPGLAPICPHCGGRRTAIAPSSTDVRNERGDPVSGQQWICGSCGGTFWSLPSLGSGSAAR